MKMRHKLLSISITGLPFFLLLLGIGACSHPQTQFMFQEDPAPSPLCPPVYFPNGNPFPYLRGCSQTLDFDFPVGPPSARGYYDAQPFGGNSAHLGEDWNGLGGGNSDLGDPVYAIGAGICFYAEDIFGGWGKVIRVVHRTGPGKFDFVESLYAHLDTMLIREGDSLQKGQQIGTIGNAHGTYYAHLHLEIRDTLGLGIGYGYSDDNQGWLIPTDFIRAH